MELFRMNLYMVWYNNGRFKSRETHEERMQLVNSAIKLTLQDGIDIIKEYSIAELESQLWSL